MGTHIHRNSQRELSLGSDLLHQQVGQRAGHLIGIEVEQCRGVSGSQSHSVAHVGLGGNVHCIGSGSRETVVGLRASEVDGTRGTEVNRVVGSCARGIEHKAGSRGQHGIAVIVVLTGSEETNAAQKQQC